MEFVDIQSGSADQNRPVPDWIINPLPRIQQIFDDCQKSGEDWKEKISKTFVDDTSDMETLSQIPWLNETPLHKLATNQVVRFRGMIQDMLEQEFFMNTFEVQRADGTKFMKPGRYVDIASCSPGEEIVFNSPNCETGDRTSYYCISIPGENKWVKEHYMANNPKFDNKIINSLNRNKRTIEDDDDNEVADDNISFSNDQHPSSLTNCSSSETKRLKEDAKEKEDKSDSQKLRLCNLNFPLPDMEGIACLVKVYGDVDLKLNDIIEAVAILSVDPSITELSSFQDELEGPPPPPSLVPRLHVFSITQKSHNNPLLPLKLSEECFPNGEHSATMRELLGSILDVALLGDALASEYLLCHLISSVYLRQNVLALGKFSINLFGISEELQNQNYSNHLYELLQTLSTHCYYLPMTLENMNKLNFIPKKDYDTNRLTSGVLQLPSHLHLVLDETKLTSGQLDSKGINNLTSLGNLINWQKVDYDFQFHSIEQQSNVPVLILSEGKSIISSDCHISFDPKHTDVALAFSKVSSILSDRRILDQVRSHLTFSELASYSLPEEMQTKVQEDFVNSRQQENGMSADDLHSLLTVAKLLAQGCGEHTLTNDIWRSAKMLESERKGRLRK